MGMSPFYALYGRNLPPDPFSAPHSTDKVPAADHWTTELLAAHAALKENLEQAQLRYKAQADANCRASPDYQAGDLVWLSRKNIVVNQARLPSPRTVSDRGTNQPGPFLPQASAINGDT